MPALGPEQRPDASQVPSSGAVATSRRAPAPRVILTGTDPTTPRGGIAAVMAQYIEALRIAGFTVEMVPTYSRSRWSDKWRLAVRALWRVPRLVRAGRRRGELVVAYAHAGGGWSLVREGLVLACARAAGAGTALQLHTADVERYTAGAFRRQLFRWALSPAQLVCVLTPYWRDRLTAAGVLKPLAVVPNPLPVASEAAAKAGIRRATGRRTGLTVGTMTRLVGGKGVDDLIRAMSVLPSEWGLVVAGAGHDGPTYEALARTLGLGSRVDFRGWLSGEEKERFFTDIDVFCLPTRYDSFGLPFVEAMARGLPVVALRWGAIPDIVVHGDTGLLVESTEPASLAAAITSLADVERRTALGSRGRTVALQRFSAEVVGAGLRASFASAFLTVAKRAQEEHA